MGLLFIFLGGGGFFLLPSFWGVLLGTKKENLRNWVYVVFDPSPAVLGASELFSYLCVSKKLS